MSFPSPDATQYVPKQARRIVSRRKAGQLARAGYLAIGVVYLLISVLAGLSISPLGYLNGGKVTGSAGAARTLMNQPFGRVLLGLIAAGLATYVCWRFAQAILNIEDRGTGAYGVLRRAGLLVSGFSYGLLTVAAIRTLISSGQAIQHVDEQKADWTADLMAAPAGSFLVGLIGAGILIGALDQFRKAYKAGFMAYLNLSAMSTATQRAVNALGRFGLAARGVVFGIIGAFLIVAALHSNASEARGLGGALKMLANQPYGTWLIGVVAAGFFAHGLHMLTKVRYRRIAPPDDLDEADAFSSRHFGNENDAAAA